MEFATPYRPRSRIPPKPGRPYFAEKGMGDRAHLFGDLITIYAGGEQAERTFNFFTCEGPKGDTIPTHSHSETYEVFYVTAGAARLFVEGTAGEQYEKLLGAGDFGFLPKNCPHAYRIERHHSRSSEWRPGRAAPSSVLRAPGCPDGRARPPARRRCRSRASSRPSREITTYASFRNTADARRVSAPRGSSEHGRAPARWRRLRAKPAARVGVGWRFRAKTTARQASGAFGAALPGTSTSVIDQWRVRWR
ncbi:cupin domain-containing protein [Saccharopolyspora shandongensis]|uniref:cupin domain-containing protein n=1 Tax=Saccharopolyspora shandongensis TaxID=418495 RepID=UPI0033CBDDA0